MLTADGRKYNDFHGACQAILEVPASDVGEAMGNDILQTWVNNNYAMEGIIHERDGERHVDFWGITWEKEGVFNQPVDFPLAGSTEHELQAYTFPQDKLDFLLHLMDPVVERQEDLFIGCDISPCAFEMYWRLHGLEQALVDIAANPQLAHMMLRRCVDFAHTEVVFYGWSFNGGRASSRTILSQSLSKSSKESFKYC